MKTQTLLNNSNTAKNFDTSNLYRMPWTNSDNSNAWLNVTRNCNITCEYCVQEHVKSSHKDLKSLKTELEGIVRLRKCDSIQIAGGEPLMHPQIAEIVQMVKSYMDAPANC